MKEEKIGDFFDTFPNPQLAHFIWNIAEDARIEYRMKSKYAGIENKFNFIDEELFKQIKPQQGLSKKEKAVELMIHLTAFGKTKEEIPPDIKDIVTEGYNKLKGMASMDKKPVDSLKTAMEVYELIDKIPGEFNKQPNPLSNPLNLDAAKKRKSKDMEEMRERLEPSGGGNYSDEELEEMLDDDKSMADDCENSQLEEDGNDDSKKGGNQKEGTGKEKGKDNTLGEKDESGGAGEEKKTPDKGKRAKDGGGGKRGGKGIPSEDEKRLFVYDEWDYKISDYRYRWCILKEVELPVHTISFVKRSLAEYSKALQEIKKQFQMIKPSKLKKIKKEEFGDEIDIDEAVAALIDLKAGIQPSDKIYIKTLRQERDISAAFVIDLSGSTSSGCGMSDVLGLEKIALLLLMEAMDVIGDSYGVFGYDSIGHLNNRCFVIKDFDEKYNDKIRGRLEGLVSGHSTRTGPALRHATAKLYKTGSKTKILFHITDGQPTCTDFYSEKTYAIQDVKKALEEARKRAIFPVQIVVNNNPVMSDIKEMYTHSPYVIVEDPRTLPQKLIKIYRNLTT